LFLRRGSRPDKRSIIHCCCNRCFSVVIAKGCVVQGLEWEINGISLNSCSLANDDKWPICAKNKIAPNIPNLKNQVCCARLVTKVIYLSSTIYTIDVFSKNYIIMQLRGLHNPQNENTRSHEDTQKNSLSCWFCKYGGKTASTPWSE